MYELNGYLSIAVELFVIRFLPSSSKPKTIFISSCKQVKRLKHYVTLECFKMANVLKAV